MHEVSLVAELVDACLVRTGEDAVTRVTVRHASTVPEEALRQAFTMVTAGTPLENAELETEAFELTLVCQCGFAGPLRHEDEIGGSLVACPSCGDVHPAPRTAELELLRIETVCPSSVQAVRAVRPYP